jgi:chemotaxis protein methyltransferase CheR
MESAIRRDVPEFLLSDDDFGRLRDFIYRHIGVQFAEGNRPFVDKRILTRARVTGSRSFHEYFMQLRFDESGAELQALVNLLTVNETYFFRENDQIETLVRVVLPEIAARKAPGDPIRVWSLPCSTGEEPYSIAIAVLEGWRDADRYRIEILASDIDTRVLADAAAGVYGERSLQNVGRALRKRYFRRRIRAGVELHEIVPELRGSIDFFQINVSNEHEMARVRDVDVVFCRNLLIYFDDVSRREAVESIFECLTPGGIVFLGHAENMSRMSSLFVPRRYGDLTLSLRPA